MERTKLSAIVIAMSALLFTDDSHAQTATSTSSESAASAALIGTTLGFAAWTGAVRLFAPQPRYGFKIGLLFDDDARELFRLEDEQARDSVSQLSDIFQTTLITQPFTQAGYLYLTDELTAQQAWSRALISLHSFALSSAIIFSTKTFVGRVRPKTPECSPGLNDITCASSPLRMSFISGHTTAAFTGAGLLCALPEDSRTKTIYEKLACPVALTLATTTGLFRVMSDNHYATDVLAGALAGTFSGWLIPRLIYASQNSFEKQRPKGMLSSPYLPGAAHLTAIISYEESTKVGQWFPGAKMTVTQYLRRTRSSDYGGLVGLDARLERGTDDTQRQRVSIRAGASYQTIDLYGLARWFGQQDGTNEAIRFGSGVGIMHQYRFSPSIRFRYGLDFVLSSEQNLIGGTDLFIELGPWLHSYVRLEKGLAGDQQLQSATLGFGGQLSWGQW